MQIVEVDPVEVWLGDRHSFDEYSPRTGWKEGGCDYFVLIVDDVELLEDGLMYDMVATSLRDMKHVKARRPT